MSLVLVVSRGILASTSPADTISPSCTIKRACDGMWYLRLTFPSLPLISTPFVRHASARDGLRHSDGPRTPRPRGREHPMIYTCSIEVAWASRARWIAYSLSTEYVMSDRFAAIRVLSVRRSLQLVDAEGDLGSISEHIRAMTATDSQ